MNLACCSIEYRQRSLKSTNYDTDAMIDPYYPEPSDYADILFASHVVQSNIEDELNDLFGPGDYVLDTWHDHYDYSLEVGFSSRIPDSFSADQRLVELIKKWGFGMVYLNFADGTQQHIYSKGLIGERKFWHDNDYRWNREKADKLE
jgi:hypothetical protein